MSDDPSMTPPPLEPEADPAAEKAPSRAAQWRALSKEFVRTHGEWVNRLPPGEAAYVLPEQIIASLAAPRGWRRQLSALVSPEDAQAERAFGKMCRDCGRDDGATP